MTKAERKRLQEQRIFHRDGHEYEFVERNGDRALVLDEDGKPHMVSAILLVSGDDKRASARFFHERLRKLGHATYADYLRSPHWQKVRRRYFASGLPKGCWICGARPVVLHHRTYVRLGREYLADLQPLCRRHHADVHAHERDHGTDLWFAATAVKREARMR